MYRIRNIVHCRGVYYSTQFTELYNSSLYMNINMYTVQEYEDRLGSGGIKESENPVWGSARQDDLNQLITKRQVKSK